jgi:RimJ/RimL family protein N-acetyltransferase
MNIYKVLNNQIFKRGGFKLLPIRFEDRFEIMKWRNEQIYHLRQNRPLTNEDQEKYFKTVIQNLYEQEQPNQILFSFLENDILIGYGGLVHINWLDKNAEISFIMNTLLEKNRFYEIWTEYIYLIEKVAFKELKLHKVYTYAFDLRPHLYEFLLTAGFKQDARLKEHCFINNKFLDVIIHFKINL